MRTKLGILVVFLLWPPLFELGVRLDDWVRFRTPLLSPFHSQGELMIRDIDGMHGRPNARFKKWVLNSNGTRGPEFSIVKPPSTFRIATLGASETFGLYEAPNKEYPRQLEDSLEAMRRDGRCRCAGIQRFEVINAAILGMSLPTVSQDVRNRLRRYSPDLAVLYPSPVEYLNETTPVPARPDSSTPRDAAPASNPLYPRALWRAHEQIKEALPTPVMDMLRRIDTKRQLRGRDPNWAFTHIPADRMEAFCRDLSGAIAAIKEIGARPVLVSHANVFFPGKPRDEAMLVAWRRFYPRATADVIVAFDDSAAIETRRIAEADSLPFLDWNRKVAGLGRSPFEDFAHFTDWGSAVIAGELAKLIVHTLDDRGTPMSVATKPKSARRAA